MSATILPFPRPASLPDIEVFEKPDGSAWTVLVSPDGGKLSRSFASRTEALAYSAGLQAGTGWRVTDWALESGEAA
jgi:hypothetical protein